MFSEQCHFRFSSVILGGFLHSSSKDKKKEVGRGRTDTELAHLNWTTYCLVRCLCSTHLFNYITQINIPSVVSELRGQ